MSASEETHIRLTRGVGTIGRITMLPRAEHKDQIEERYGDYAVLDWLFHYLPVLLFIIVVWIGYGIEPCYAVNLSSLAAKGASSSYPTFVQIIDPSHEECLTCPHYSGLISVRIRSLTREKAGHGEIGGDDRPYGNWVIPIFSLIRSFHRQPAHTHDDLAMALYNGGGRGTKVVGVDLKAHCMALNKPAASVLKNDVTNSYLGFVGSDVLVVGDIGLSRHNLDLTLCNIGLPGHNSCLHPANGSLPPIDADLKSPDINKRTCQDDGGQPRKRLNPGWPIGFLACAGSVALCLSPIIMLHGKTMFPGILLALAGCAAFFEAANASVNGVWWP